MIRRSSALVASLLVSLLTACPSDDGGGGGGGGGDETHAMSGTVTAAAGQEVDSDTGDPNATAVGNDSPGTAQALPSTVTLGGWVDDTADAADTFSTSLAAGQVVTLVPADAAATLDICVAPTDFSFEECSTNAAGDAVQFSVTDGGEYYLQVQATSGSSNYTLVLGQGPASANAVRVGTPFVPGEVVVRFRDGAVSAQAVTGGPRDLAAVARGLGLVALGGSLHDGPVLLGLPDAPDARASALAGLGARRVRPSFAAASLEVRQRQETRDLIAALRARADVASADPNYVFQPSAVPNDTYYGLQWHYPLIQLPQAWDLADGTIDSGPRAGGHVIVSVADTGIVENHPDLVGQTVPGFDFISNAAMAGDGGGVDANPHDDGDATGGAPSSFHGTHVAGTVAAKSKDAAGVAGVSWNARILPVRVLGRGGGTSFDIIQGVRWSAGLSAQGAPANPNKADVINLSLGCLNCFSATEQAEYTNARNAGVIIIAAAGNEDSTLRGYPASYDGVVSVAAVDLQKARAPYSNHNDLVDIAAPGGNTGVDLNADGYVDGVLSTLAEQNAAGAPTDPNWTFYQGTSMAAPHMAGVVALMKEMCIGLTPAQLDTLITSDKITDGAGLRDNNFGYGLVNALKAVQEAQKICTGTDPTEAGLGVDPVSVDFGAAATARTVNVSKIGTGTLADVAVVESIPWLSVSSVAAPGLGTYTLTVDRGSLPDGVYGGAVTFTAGTKSVTVEVSMRVGAAAPTTGDVGYLYVLVVDPASGETLGQADGNGSSGTYAWSFNGVPTGDYVLIAGTDSDNDGFICDEGEACGAWPTLGAPSAFTVDQDVSGLDFTVGFSSGLGLQAADGERGPAGGVALPGDRAKFRGGVK